MSIIMFAIIGYALNLSGWYWLCLALYSSWHATIAFAKFLSINNNDVNDA